MLLSIRDAPYAVRCLPAVPYGKAAATTRDWVMSLYLDLLLPEPRPTRPAPVVVYVHGGGWESGDKAAGMYPWNSPLLAAHGFVAANVGYRLSWMAPHPAQIDDVTAAIDWLRENAERYGIDPAHLGIWGDSAGGHLAALLGVSRPGAVQAVIARSTPFDMTWVDPNGDDTDPVGRRLVGGPPSEHPDVLRELSPLHQVGADVPPFLVVHGTDDELVSFDGASAFVRALRDHGADVTFHVVESGDHALRRSTAQEDESGPGEALGREALDFFAKHLRD